MPDITVPEVDGVITSDEVQATVDAIAEWQLPNGMVPWYPGGHADPWNHVEAAMALALGGRLGCFSRSGRGRSRGGRRCGVRSRLGPRRSGQEGRRQDDRHGEKRQHGLVEDRWVPEAEAAMRDLAADQCLWYDADDFAACFQCRISGRTHQAQTSTAINNSYAALRQRSPDMPCAFNISRVFGRCRTNWIFVCI